MAACRCSGLSWPERIPVPSVPAGCPEELAGYPEGPAAWLGRGPGVDRHRPGPSPRISVVPGNAAPNPSPHPSPRPPRFSQPQLRDRETGGRTKPTRPGPGRPPGSRNRHGAERTTSGATRGRHSMCSHGPVGPGDASCPTKHSRARRDGGGPEGCLRRQGRGRRGAGRGSAEPRVGPGAGPGLQP